MDNKFEPGEIQYSEGAVGDLGLEVDDFLVRHLQGDWGDINDSDKALNMNALRKGKRLISYYKTSPGRWLMIITNPERTLTSIQLYEDYLQEDKKMTEGDLAACIQALESWNSLTPQDFREFKIISYQDKVYKRLDKGIRFGVGKEKLDFDLPPIKIESLSPIQKDIAKLYHLQKKIVWWAKLLILIGFTITLVQFVIWLLLG